MKTLFKWFFIAIGIILGSAELYSADVKHWYTNGSVFNMEFEATPICVRDDTVVGIPRGESREIAINNRNGKLSLTYSRISGMKERLVDDLLVEQNEEVMDIFGYNDASVYYDRYEIRIGGLKWSSNDPTNLFSEVVPEAKKVQNTLLSFPLGESDNGTNRKSSSNKPPLKK